MSSPRYNFWLETNPVDFTEIEQLAKSLDSNATVQKSSTPHDRAFPLVDVAATTASIIYISTVAIDTVRVLRDHFKKKIRQPEDSRPTKIYTDKHDKKILADLDDSNIKSVLHRSVKGGEDHD